jgi:LemA protein
MILELIFIGILLFLAFYFYALYASLVKKKNNVKESFSGIDTQLKKRYDLIPNILTIAQKFMEHEKGLLEEVTKLRGQAMGVSNNLAESEKKFALDKEINAKLGQIMVAVENYPQLKSDATMIEAMRAYQDAEEHIAAARRFYNSAVLELNNKTDIFPTSIIAAMCNVQRMAFFEAEEVARKSINASEFFN